MEKYNNRLICYLDVLGYSALIDKHGTQYVYDSYSKFVDEAKNKAFYGKTFIKDKEKDIFVVSDIVSDYMLFVSNEISDVFSVNNFVGAIHTILELGLENNFLFRGAITLGDIIYDKDKERSIFLSKEYNKLAKFEPTMELPMCVIFDEAKNIITESMYGSSIMKEGIVPAGDLPIIKYNIPFKEYRHITEDNYIKEYTNKEMWCLNYTFFSSEETLQKVQDFLTGDKQTNFVKYLEFIKQIPSQSVILDEKFLPFKYLQIMKSRSGMRIAFLDDKMSVIQAEEHQAFQTDFIVPPSEFLINYDFKTKQLSVKAKGRWKE